MQRVIEVTNLHKTYRDVHAVKNVTFDIKKGEIYGLIDLNGAGKTTLIRLLLGLISPTKGKCKVNGKHVTLRNHTMWQHVGYIVESPHAYPELTVFENLEIHRKMRLINERYATERVISLLKLNRYTNTLARHLSLGNKQRLGIAKAIIHKPNILILDEPVNGLDPEGIVEVRALLQQLARFAIDHPDQIAKLLINEKVPLTKLIVQEETLEQYFLRTIHKGVSQ